MKPSTYFTDEIYLDSSRHLDRLKNSQPLKIHESMFGFINKFILKSTTNNVSILDIGCGFGEFLMHLGRQSSSSRLNLSGLEKSRKLADFCGKYLNDVNIHCQDLSAFCQSPPQTYDIICISGVHPTVDNLEEFLLPIKSIIHQSSLLLINGPFHTRDLSLYVQWTYDNNVSASHKGWNLYSVGSVVKIIETIGLGAIDNHVIEIPPIDEDINSLAQFNITANSGLKYYLNGLGLRFSINTLAFQNLSWIHDNTYNHPYLSLVC